MKEWKRDSTPYRMFFVRKNKTKGESPREMITPEEVIKVKEVVEKIVPAHKQKRGRPREYSDRTIVLLHVLYVLLRCSSIVEMYKMIQGKKRLLKVIGELPSRQTLSYRFRRLDIKAISDRIIRIIESETYIIDSTPIKDITSQGVKKCKNLKFGKNNSGFFWGKKAHFITTGEGIPVKFKLTEANEDDARVGKEMLDDLSGLIIADRGYFKESFLSQFTKEGKLRAIVRPRSKKKDSDFKQKHSQTYSKRWKIERLFQKMKEVFRVETPRKGGRDDVYSRVTALFLALVTLALSKFVFDSPILDYLNCF